MNPWVIYSNTHFWVLLSGPKVTQFAFGLPDIQWGKQERELELTKNPSCIRHCARYFSLHHLLSITTNKKFQMLAFRMTANVKNKTKIKKYYALIYPTLMLSHFLLI